MLIFALAGVLFVFVAYVVYPALCRLSAWTSERDGPMPGDDLVPGASTGYTLAVDIAASPAEVWPWLVQMGYGRAGFYTHTWVERVFGAPMHNADRLEPSWQQLAVGDRIWLTPDPYLKKPGQYLTVARCDPSRALVLVQELPNGTRGTWSFSLAGGAYRTRLVFRHRGTRLSVFDHVMMPGYYFMDRGMLEGIKARAERYFETRTIASRIDASSGGVGVSK